MRTGYVADGYEYEWDGARYRLKHRIVMERHLGRPLRRSEIIRHIDGDNLNNELSNLVIEEGPREEAWVDLECDYCGDAFSRPRSHVHEENKYRFCSRDCYYSARRQGWYNE